jgi:hypothetical protein
LEPVSSLDDDVLILSPAKRSNKDKKFDVVDLSV